MSSSLKFCTLAAGEADIYAARARAFEYLSETAGSSSTNTTSKYNLHLFDINMFTEITMSANQSLTINSLVTGGTSGSTGIVVAATSANAIFTLQGVTGRFTTGEAITHSFDVIFTLFDSPAQCVKF